MLKMLKEAVGTGSSFVRVRHSCRILNLGMSGGRKVKVKVSNGEESVTS